jgi:hydrogenase small subunit
MTPFYSHIGGIPGFGIHATADKVGIWAAVGVAGAYAAGGLVQLARRMKQSKAEASAAPQETGGQS